MADNTETNPFANKIYDPRTGMYHEDYLSDPNAILPDSYYGVGEGFENDSFTVDGPAVINPFIRNMTIDEWKSLPGGTIDEYGTPKPAWWDDVDSTIQDAYLKDKERFYNKPHYQPKAMAAPGSPAPEMAHSNIDGLLGRAQKMGQTMPESFGGTNQNPTQEPNWNELRAQSQDSGGFMSKFGTGEGAIANFFRNRWKR
tara:strand:+ start:140 stop:736 length:597 start_codon:yes stop_codon:yes gene_type:complete